MTQERTPLQLEIVRYLLQNYTLPRGRSSFERLLTKTIRWPQTATFTFRFGRFVDVSLAPWPYGYRSLFLHGMMEEDNTRLLLSILQPGDTFIDGGANQGYYSLVAAQAVGPEGHVYAFEPVPTTVDHLQRHVEASGIDWIEVVQAGLSERRGELQLHVFDEDPMGVQSSTVQRISLGSSRTVICPTYSLDEFVKKAGNKIAIIKLDVEGCELPALRGAEQILSSGHAPAVWFEYNEESAQGMGYHAQDVVTFLQDKGYSAYLASLSRGSLSLQSFEINREVEIRDWTPMVFCLKPGFMRERAERAGLLSPHTVNH